MTDSKHTPGPCKLIEREVLEDSSVYPRHIIAGVMGIEVCLLESPAVANAYVNDPAWQALGRSEMQQANGERIVACWNACLGLGTEHLEELAKIGGFKALMAGEVEANRSWINEIIAQRDELLEALEGLLADISEYQTINNLPGAENNHAQVAAQTAIAKERGAV